MRWLLLFTLVGFMGCTKAKEVPKGPNEGERYRVKQEVIFDRDPAALRVYLDKNTTMYAKKKLDERPWDQGGGLLTPGREIQVRRALDDSVVECNVSPEINRETGKPYKEIPSGWLYLPRFVFLVPGHLDKLPSDKAKGGK